MKAISGHRGCNVSVLYIYVYIYDIYCRFAYILEIFLPYLYMNIKYVIVRYHYVSSSTVISRHLRLRMHLKYSRRFWLKNRDSFISNFSNVNDNCWKRNNFLESYVRKENWNRKKGKKDIYISWCSINLLLKLVQLEKFYLIRSVGYTHDGRQKEGQNLLI